jgi:integrase/recombinase XerD
MNSIDHMVRAPDALERRVIEVWRGNGRRETTIVLYLHWVRRFLEDCKIRNVDGIGAMTRRQVVAFARRYARRRQMKCDAAVRASCMAMRAWSFALARLGRSVPDWTPQTAPARLPPLLAEFADFRRSHRGLSPSTIRMDSGYLVEFLAALRRHRRDLAAARPSDIDAIVVSASSHYSSKTLARMCCAIRAFLRFLHQTGRIPNDLASSVVSPAGAKLDHPRRALPWEDVQRLLAAIDVGRRKGRRDYALLLMMATYGMGAAEILTLRLQDIDWRAATLHVVRPKTGVSFCLPLLPAVGEALLAYLQDGRPLHATSREVFLSAVLPHAPMTSGGIRHVVRDHARAAGIRAEILGSHVLRHSHACRQVELGAPTQVVSDILGHRDPASTAVYMRVATSQLRSVALPVP